MLLNLWNYLRGYVIIEVSGFSVERFINLAVHRGIYIWDIQHFNGVIKMKVSIKGYKLLKSCVKKTKCKMKIVEKIGMPFLFFRYRKRKALIGGVAFFIFIVYFLSSFVWLITIEGYDRIKHDELSSFLSENGLRIGSFKHSINAQELERLVIYEFTEISFLNIQMTGTKAIIKLTETIPEKEVIDRTTPNNIIATKDGLIESIYVSAGTPLVQVGDIVSQGDLLVTGELVLRNDETGIITDYVHSIAEVKARLYYTMHFSVPIIYTINQPTGEIKRHLRFNLMGQVFDFLPFSNNFDYYEKATNMNQLSLSENYPFPIIILTDVYQEFVPITRERSLEEMKQLAENLILQKILQEFDFSTDIIDKTIRYEEIADGLNVEVLITTTENIGQDSPMNIYYEDLEELEGEEESNNL